MNAGGLNGRVTRLERVIAPPPTHRCRACGLRHYKRALEASGILREARRRRHVVPAHERRRERVRRALRRQKRAAGARGALLPLAVPARLTVEARTMRRSGS